MPKAALTLSKAKSCCPYGVELSQNENSLVAVGCNSVTDTLPSVAATVVPVEALVLIFEDMLSRCAVS